MSLLYSRVAQLGLRHSTNIGSASAYRALSSWALHSVHQQTTRSHPRDDNKPTSRFLLYASSAATAVALTSSMTRTTCLAEFSTMASPQQTISPAATTTAITKRNISTSGAPDIVLYQFEVCPFCNKVRAFLDYHGIPYRVVEVDPLRKTELKQFSADYRKVPIALINSKQVNGSAAVISTVQSHLLQSEDTPTKNMEVEQKWLKWVDDHLIHLIAPNIYKTPGESLQTFNYITEKSKFSAWERASIRYTGAAAMYMIGKRLKKKYGIEDARESIHDAVDKWMKAVSEGGSGFLEGRKTPGVADLSVYGVLKAIKTFDTFGEIREKNQEFAEWFDRMAVVVGESSQTVEE